ncbi:hypothetical protein KI387_020886, partial [Taxus chinensis]
GRGRMSFSWVSINPANVRFSQGSIASHFSDEHAGLSLRDACSQLRNGTLRPSDFPPMRIYNDQNGVLRSYDNRRLWVFRKTGVTNVNAQLLSNPPAYRAPPPPPASAHADFFPKVRFEGGV